MVKEKNILCFLCRGASTTPMKNLSLKFHLELKTDKAGQGTLEKVYEKVLSTEIRSPCLALKA